MILVCVGIMGDDFRAPWNSPYMTTLLYWGVYGRPSIESTLCRQTLVSRTTNVIFSSSGCCDIRLSYVVTDNAPTPWGIINPLMPNGAFNICCPRDCVSQHNGAPEVPPLCRETQSLGQQMLNAPFGINGIKWALGWIIAGRVSMNYKDLDIFAQ